MTKIVADLKNLLVILTLVGVLFQSFNKLSVYVSFELNRDHIAKFLCVQKNVENNQCQGRCHLKKKLAEAEEENEKQVPRGQEEIPVILFCVGHIEDDTKQFEQGPDKALFPEHGCGHCTSPFLSGQFQPPERA